MTTPVRDVRSVPADLSATVLAVVVTFIVVLTPVVNQSPLRRIVGLLFVVFVPGYAVVAAVFPETGKSSTTERNSVVVAFRGIDGIERLVLSFGISIALVPLVGLFVEVTPWEVGLGPVLLSLSALTVAATVVAAKRRLSVPASERFRVPYRQWVQTGRESILNPPTNVDGVLNVLLTVTIIVTLGVGVYMLMEPPRGEQYTEFHLLTEDETGGLVAGEFPTEFETGEPQPIIVGVENQEREELNYTIVVQLQVVDPGGEEAVIEEREELDRFSSPSIPDNETWFSEHQLEPTIPGTELRVQYLLYRGEAPASPTRENAYRDVHLWIDVDEGE